MQPHPRLRRLIAVLALSLLLCLVTLALSQAGQTAYSQDSGPTADAGGNTVVPAATPVRELCADTGTPVGTPPGDQVRMVGDDEIFVSYTQLNDSKALRTVILDNAVGSTQLSQKESIFWTSVTNVAGQIHHLANAAADLAGDHTAELVSTYAGVNAYLGALSWYGSTSGSEWSTNDGDYKPETPVDAGAGDFDGDGKDEIAMTFRDTNDDFRVAVLRGNSSGGFATTNNTVLAAYHNDVSEQGNTNHEAIAIGDFDGDGKDEIAVAVQRWWA